MERPQLRIGIGFDSHLLTQERPLVLGGIRLPSEWGLAGHSDGDVLLHAIADAILGAAGMPDLGTLFPDTDARYRNADSAELLREVVSQVRKKGYAPGQLDCVIVCDQPRISPHAAALRARIADLLGLDPSLVGLKAKTAEGTTLALPGRSIAALATAVLVESR